MTAAETIQNVQNTVGEAQVVLSSVTIAEVGHGIYRANSNEIRERRRRFLDELKATVPIYPVTQETAEIVARVGGEQAAKGVNLNAGRSHDRSLRAGTWLCNRHEQRPRL